MSLFDLFVFCLFGPFVGAVMGFPVGLPLMAFGHLVSSGLACLESLSGIGIDH